MCITKTYTWTEKEVIEPRLEFYLKSELPASLNIPLWKFVDILKIKYSGWPEEWPLEN